MLVKQVGLRITLVLIGVDARTGETSIIQESCSVIEGETSYEAAAAILFQITGLKTTWVQIQPSSFKELDSTITVYYNARIDRELVPKHGYFWTPILNFSGEQLRLLTDIVRSC